MALNIKDPETDRIARELSAATGESITVAVRVAMEERLRRVRASGAEASVRAAIEAIMERGRARPTLDDRTPEDIIGYDERGLPS